jgi:ferrochelatase
MLSDTLAKMRDDGVKRALAFFTSAFSSYSGCRQYLEAIAVARTQVGEDAPEVHKLRTYFNHAGFIEPMIERASEAIRSVPSSRRQRARLVFTAHSIPVAMADHCNYEKQLEEACRLVAEGLGRTDWQLVWQSRSGPADGSWLEPSISEHLEVLSAIGVEDAVVVPIGFTADHMEVVWDLDEDARTQATELGLGFHRAGTVGVHPRFVQMVRELVVERMTPGVPKPVVGKLPVVPDVCAPDCCAFPRSSSVPPPGKKKKRSGSSDEEE